MAAGLVLALLTVLAIELSDTQATSKKGIEDQVHQRAVLAGALISSLFETVGASEVKSSGPLATAAVTDRVLNASAGSGGYAVLFGSNGDILAASRGVSSHIRITLYGSPVVADIRDGRAYALSDIVPYGATGIIDFAVAIPTPYGSRILVTGFPPETLSTFVTRELKSIPGVARAANYLIDGQDVILGSSDPRLHVGQSIRQVGALRAPVPISGDVHGFYLERVGLPNTSWNLVIASPDGPLFASVSGLRRGLPWLIYMALVIVALTAVALGRRVMDSADQLRLVNTRLEAVNGALTEANAALGRRAAELARSNHDLDQFAAIASHDLQEPLRKIRTFTERLTLTEADNLSEKGRDSLLRANAAATRMQTLIEDLLKFSRVTTQGHPFAPVDLGGVMTGVIDDLASQVEDCAAVVHVGSLPTILGDAAQIRQLLQNLLSNALKFRHSGRVPEVTISSQTFGDQIVLTVRDNGIGFDERYSQRIFRVFERLNGRSEYPGTGIGLALCRKIVERHGGTIVADGEVGVGSTFTTTLPVNQTEEIITISHLEDAPSSTQEGAHV